MAALTYSFGAFTLEPQERRLLRDGMPVALPPKAFDMLVLLVERQGSLVRKEELMQAIWEGRCVEEGSLSRTVHVLRRALGPSGGGEEFIQTVPTQGYRFVEGDAAGDSTEGPAAIAPPDRKLPAKRLVLSGLAVAAVLAGLALAWTKSGHRDPAPPEAQPALSTLNGAAFARYQSGRALLGRRYPGDQDAALHEFTVAAQLDPGFADAWSGVADARMNRFWNNGSHEDIALARVAMERALKLDGRSAYALALQCRLKAVYDWDFAGAGASCREALAIEPGNSDAHRELGFLLHSQGRHDEALNEIDAAIALSPTSFNKRSRGVLLYFSGRYDEAIDQLLQVNETDPEYREGARWIARSLEQKQDYARALEYLVRSREADVGPNGQRERLEGAFSTGGWPAVLRASLPQDPGRASLEIAGTLAQLGQHEQAFAALGSMIAARQVMILHLRSEPRLDPLKADPRFEEIARRVGLP